MKLPFYQSLAIMLSYFTVLSWLHLSLPAPCNHEQLVRPVTKNYAVQDTMACDDFKLISTHQLELK